MAQTADRKRMRATVRGIVQGVGFRAFVQREARRIGVSGWVRNLPDGSVETEAEGREPQLLGFQRTLRNGPPGSSVESMETEWLEATGALHGFAIRY